MDAAEIERIIRKLARNTAALTREFSAATETSDQPAAGRALERMSGIADGMAAELVLLQAQLQPTRPESARRRVR